jgi:hypothetical protein
MSGGLATVLAAYQQILAFPLDYPDYVPSLIPIFVGLVVLELYFGRYTDEHLGWNSAVSNATLIITTGLTLIVELGLLHPLTSVRAVVAYGVLGLGTLILLLNFFHRWPAELAFNLSSSRLSYTLVYITIAIVYAGMSPTAPTVIAGTSVLVTVFVVFSGIRRVEQRVIA